MNTIRALLTGAVLAATTVLAAPLTAAAEHALPASHDAPATESAPTAPHGAAADGYLHVYYGFNFTDYCGGWVGNSSHWGACRNRTASLWNNGYPGGFDDVRVYWGTNYTGANRGVHNGVALGDLRQWTFDNNTGPGSGQWLYRNISSHLWVNL